MNSSTSLITNIIASNNHLCGWLTRSTNSVQYKLIDPYLTAKELSTLREQLPQCEAAITAAKDLVRGVEERLEECIAEHVRIKEELAGQKELIRLLEDENKFPMLSLICFF